MNSTTYTLPSGLIISRVITGLWQIADMEKDGTQLDPATTAQAMAPYQAAGLTTFDMADHYGSAEVIAGYFRNNFSVGKSAQMLTKWVPKPGKSSMADTRAAVELAMHRLGTVKIDLMQFHAWNYLDPTWLDQLFWLDELRKEGLIGHLGLTNFDAAHLRIVCASGIPIATNQVCHSLLDQRASGQMTEVCQQYGVKILAFGTVAGGFFSEKWLDKPEPSMDALANWSLMKYKRFIDTAGGWGHFQSLLRVLHGIAAKHSTSIANIASGYMLQKPEVAAVIIGARLGKSEHIADTAKLFTLALDADDISTIEAATAKLSPIPGDCGDEYRKPPFLTASGDLSHHLDQMPMPYTPEPGAGGRAMVLSGTTWEDMAGYSRAVKMGSRIAVSGTTATHGTRMIGGSDPAAQTQFILDKIQGAIESLGGKLEHVVRTRIFVSNIGHWEPVARAHGQRFAHIKPANTLVEAKLVGDGYLVEIEADAEIS